MSVWSPFLTKGMRTRISCVVCADAEGGIVCFWNYKIRSYNSSFSCVVCADAEGGIVWPNLIISKARYLDAEHAYMHISWRHVFGLCILTTQVGQLEGVYRWIWTMLLASAHKGSTVQSSKQYIRTTAYKSLHSTATVLQGLFGEYHSSSAALGLQCPEVTKQPLASDCTVTHEPLWC